MLNILRRKQTGDDYNLLFKHYRTVINKHLAVFDKEDLNGWDCGHLSVSLWYGSFLYATMFKSALSSGFYTLSQLKELYLYDSLKDCLNCQKIPIAEMLYLLGIDAVNGVVTNGIEFMAIESNNVVEDCNCIPTSTVVEMEGYIGTTESIALFQTMWAAEPSCELLLTSTC